MASMRRRAASCVPRSCPRGITRPALSRACARATAAAGTRPAKSSGSLGGNMKTGFKVLIALGAVSVGGAGCDNRSTDATVRSETVLALSEPESAAVLSRVNAGEIETAQVFRPLGAHDDAIGFADQMIDAHSRAEGLLLATGVPQQPNSLA